MFENFISNQNIDDRRGEEKSKIAIKILEEP